MSQQRRLELHKIFTDLLGTTGQKETRVYFQPPATLKIKYPCIVYNRGVIDQKFADDKEYSGVVGYTVISIDPNPDSDIPDKIRTLPMCRFNRHYTADLLNHDAFTIYY